MNWYLAYYIAGILAGVIGSLIAVNYSNYPENKYCIIYAEQGTPVSLDDCDVVVE